MFSLNTLVVAAAVFFGAAERPDDGDGRGDEGDAHEDDRHSREYHGGEVAGRLLIKFS